MKKSLLPAMLFLALCLAHAATAQIYDTIPVIVHIIHNGEAVGSGTNLSQAQVYSQFDVLNEDYRMQNADLANTPTVFTPLIADMGLNFEKALADPNNNILAEPGINRIDRNAMGWTSPPWSMTYTESTIKPQTAWDPYRYLNIWVMNLSGGMLGYATMPVSSGLGCLPAGTADTLRDGIVVLYSAFGRTGNVQAPYDKGRTATFEIGRWLGLKQYSSQSSCDDCVADTPPTSATHYGCPVFPQVASSCSSSPDGDLFMNFMSYVDDACKYMFTQGQKARIDTCLTNAVFQSALRLSNAGDPTAVKEAKHMLHASVHPNPSTGNFIVRLPGNIDCNVTVHSLLGEMVHESIISNSAQSGLQLGHLPAGMYMLQLKSAKGNYVQRIVICN